MTNETTAPSGTESRILDQIVAEITGVIAKWMRAISNARCR